MTIPQNPGTISSAMRRMHDHAKPNAPVMALSDCPRGMHAVIDGIDLDERHRFHLYEIGLAPGAQLRIMQRGAFGGRVVALGGERVALDNGTAQAIRIRPVQDETTGKAGTQ